MVSEVRSYTFDEEGLEELTQIILHSLIVKILFLFFGCNKS